MTILAVIVSARRARLAATGALAGPTPTLAPGRAAGIGRLDEHLDLGRVMIAGVLQSGSTVACHA